MAPRGIAILLADKRSSANTSGLTSKRIPSYDFELSGSHKLSKQLQLTPLGFANQLTPLQGPQSVTCDQLSSLPGRLDSAAWGSQGGDLVCLGGLAAVEGGG